MGNPKRGDSDETILVGSDAKAGAVFTSFFFASPKKSMVKKVPKIYSTYRNRQPVGHALPNQNHIPVFLNRITGGIGGFYYPGKTGRVLQFAFVGAVPSAVKVVKFV